MKNWALGVGLSILAVFAPIKPLLISVGFLMFADTVSGIWAAKKRGEAISSAKLRSSVSKAFIYQLCIVTGFVLETFILDRSLPVSKIIAGAIGVVELRSLLENADSITGTSVFNEIKRRIGSPNLDK